MFIESGIVIFLGLLMLGAKLKPSVSLRLLGHPLMLDLAVSAVAFIMHYGTFTGVMAAAVAGLMCSTFSSIARYAFGYITSNVYYPGKVWNLSRRLK